MKYRLPFFFAAAVAFALPLFAPLAAHAACVGAPDQKCDPAGGEDCSCDDCLAACSGECTASNPPACTLEDACTCNECWADEACTDPKKDNCTNDSVCDFFLEGCCCDDCASLANCNGFTGTCTVGGGGSGGATGGGGSGGATGGAGGTTGATGGGGSGGLTAPKSGCGCSVAGTDSGSPLALFAGALALGTVARRRRRSSAARST